MASSPPPPPPPSHPPPPPPPPDDGRRKRKWDEGPTGPPAPPEPPSSEADDALSAAAAAAAQAAAALSRTYGTAGGVGPEEHSREFEINDHPGRRFAMMSANIRAVETRASVAIVSKGRYYPPGAAREPLPGDEHRPLFLKIVGPSAASVAAAVSHLEEVMAPRAPDPARPDRVWADMDASSAPAFDVVARMRGPAGEYVSYIEEQSGARVEIAGRGVVPHARENLHFAVRGDAGAVAKARGLCQSLCRAIRPVFDEYRKTHYPEAAAQAYGNGRPHGAPRGGGGFGAGGSGGYAAGGPGGFASGPGGNTGYAQAGPPAGAPAWMSGRQ